MAEVPRVVFITGDGAPRVISDCSNFEVVEVNSTQQTPSEALVDMMSRKINLSSGAKLLFIGFPRSVEDAAVFEAKTGIVPKLVLVFMKKDSSLFQDFKGHTYETKGLLKRICPSEDVSDRIQELFSSLVQEELLELSEQLLVAIDSGDYDTYKKLCDEKLTAFEPESQGQLVEGLPFHKFYFDMRNSGGKFIQRVSTIAAPKVALLSDDAALVTYTRLMQGIGTPLAGYVDAYNETRVWKRKTVSGKTQWKNVHFHRSRAPTVPEFYKVTT